LTDPAKLKRIVSLIDAETWIGIGVDVKGAIYEGLLERNAAEVKSGAGQYFTPRPLIQAMVTVMNPPFGKKSSYRVVGDDGAVETEQEHYEREDFKFTTSNKQLNFMQHIMTVMESDGRAAVVLPDNVLFEAGSAHDHGARVQTERFKRFDVNELLKRDKLNLDIFWLKDESLDDVDSLPSPDVIAAEIVENLQAALEAFQSVADDLALARPA
jgi:hypothetical protein